jgi:hypothetical protein
MKLCKFLVFLPQDVDDNYVEQRDHRDTTSLVTGMQDLTNWMGRN